MIAGPGASALTVSGNHASRVIRVTGANVTIRGLTIADGSSGAFDGAGIRAGGSVLSISDCVITNNSSSGAYGGGGIFNSPGVTLTVSNCTISGNSAASGSLGGGGIHNDQGVLSVVDCAFSGNSARSGGGIYNFYGTLRINASTLSGNSAGSDGGGIFHRSGVTLTVSNCTISANSANGSGGGICNSNSMLTVVASTLSGNSAGFGGGIMNNGEAGSATLTLVASTLSSNSAAGGGGGILNWGQSGNATLTINASTFSGNAAGGSGGGAIMNNNFAGAGTVEIGDTIFNAGAAGANIYNYSGPVMSDGYNLSSDDSGSSFLTTTGDQNNTDPQLGPLQDTGGPTFTHALLPDSPALDQGNANAISGLGLTTDQRGFSRPADFAGILNATSGDGSDIGAFEAQVFSGNPPRLTGAMKSGSGPFQFAFTNNTPGVTFTVFTTTNVALPFSNWTVLGVPIEIAPGQFQFTDAQATNNPQRFYRMTSP